MNRDIGISLLPQRTGMNSICTESAFNQQCWQNRNRASLRTRDGHCQDRQVRYQGLNERKMPEKGLGEDTCSLEELFSLPPLQFTFWTTKKDWQIRWVLHLSTRKSHSLPGPSYLKLPCAWQTALCFCILFFWKNSCTHDFHVYNFTLKSP